MQHISRKRKVPQKYWLRRQMCLQKYKFLHYFIFEKCINFLKRKRIIAYWRRREASNNTAHRRCLKLKKVGIFWKVWVGSFGNERSKMSGQLVLAITKIGALLLHTSRIYFYIKRLYGKSYLGKKQLFPLLLYIFAKSNIYFGLCRRIKKVLEVRSQHQWRKIFSNFFPKYLKKKMHVREIIIPFLLTRTSCVQNGLLNLVVMDPSP